MSSTNPLEHELSRRSALAYTAAVVFSTLASACDFSSLEPSNEANARSTPFNAFMFVHDESVDVVISAHDNPEKFTLTVVMSGKELERYEGLTDKTVGDIESDYIETWYIDPPG